MRIFNRHFLFFLICFCLPLYGRDTVLDLADNFFDSGFYNEAITEYQRYIFFNHTGDHISDSYYKIGLAYRNLYNLEKSLDALEFSVQTANSDSIKDERKIDIAVNYIAWGRYSEAKMVLLKLMSFSKIPEARRKASLFLGITHLYCYEWESAKDALEMYFKEERNDEAAYIVDSLLSQARDIKYKSPETAKWLSTFIPGTGQVYVGNAGDGINALVLNGANIYFIIYKLLKEEYGNAFLIYYFLFRRYYMGNIYNAGKEAREYNRDLNEKTAGQILDLLRAVESE
jgi:hypothetical protein